MDLAALEARLLQHAPSSPRGSYPPEIFPVIDRVAAKGVPAKLIAKELHKEPAIRKKHSFPALYRRVCRHLEGKAAQPLT